jgi:hypothetical protein
MAFKVLAGPYVNHLARCATAPVMTPAALTAFPVAGLFDNRGALPARFSAYQEDSDIVIDLNMIRGGAADTAGDEAYWTALGTEGLAVDAGDSHAGAASFLLSGIVLYVQDITVRAGEQLHFRAACSGAGSAAASVLVRNRQTGNFLQWDASWLPPSSTSGDIANATPILVAATAAWETISIPFTVESYEVCKRDTVTLRVYLWGSSGDRFDELYLWPLTNWCSIHGHNISPFIVPKLQRGDDGSTWTTDVTMTILPDSFYSPLASMKDYRYWRLLLEGFPDVASLTYLGELVLGQSFDLIHNPEYGGSLTWNERQTRLESGQGEEWVALHNTRAQRGLMLTYGFRKDDEYVQFRDKLFRGSRGGANVIVIAPVEMDAEQVILGRIRESTTIVKSSYYRRAGELEVIESPLPNVPDLIHAYDLPLEEPI